MSRITHVELDSFKKQLKKYELGALTLLSGPNGSGKSAVLEGLRYALSGEVPTGKSLDAVAQYFPARGGAVLVIDADGNWIRRGITRDHEKAKVSQELEEEGDAEWIANEALLDMRGFLALSPNKRREFVLELVGAGETPTEAEVHRALAAEYARQIGGPGAEVSLLDGREKDLPEDLRPLANRWQAIWGILRSYLKTGEQTASAIFQRLAEQCSSRKNAARRAANEAKAAIRELEAAAKGAEAAAADLERRRQESLEQAERLTLTREAAATRREAESALEQAAGDLVELGARLEHLDAATAGFADPGPRPEPPDETDQQALELARREADVARQQLTELSAAERELGEARRELERAEADVVAIDAEPLSRLVAAAEKVEGVYERAGALGHLLDVVDEFATVWRIKRDVAVERVAAAADEAHGHATRHAELAKETPSRAEYDKVVGAIGKLELAIRERRQAYDAALEAWQTLTRRHDHVRAEQAAATERYAAARTRQDALAERLRGMVAPDVETAAGYAREAREALEAAEEAAGAVKAYREAVERAKAEKVSEKAWKAAEAACKRARETYVADVVRPLVDDVGKLLAAAGRSERVYLELENARGKPVFDLGLIRGKERVSLSALSGGESVLFTTALALTIARRSTGRRVLLIEADPLDETNLARLLSALGAMNVELDAALVATSTEVEQAAGWKVIRFSQEGVK